MRRDGSMFRLLKLFTAMLCFALLPPAPASAQRQPGGVRVVDPDLMAADYFTAKLNPKMRSWLALVELGHAGEATWKFYRTGQYKSVLADCKYTLERFANHPGALFLMGKIAIVLKEPSLPIPYFEEALRRYPQYAYTHAQYGHYLVELGATAAGIAELREALRLDPNHLLARTWLEKAMAARPAEGQHAAGDSTTVK